MKAPNPQTGEWEGVDALALNDDTGERITVARIKNTELELSQTVNTVGINIDAFKIQTPESNDTGRINRAITHVSSKGGGVVVIPENTTYSYSGHIVLKENVSFIGSNKKTSQLKSLTNDSNIQIHNISNVILSNFTLDGNFKKSRISIQALTTNMSNIIVDNVIVKNGGNIADSATWTNNIQVKRWGINNLKDVWLTNLFCEHAAGDGTSYGDNICIESYGSDGSGKLTNVIIANCILKKAGRQNISLAGDNTASRPSGITISNVICEDSTMGGVDFEEADKVTISNAHFINSGKYTAFFNGTHFAERFPDTIMKSGISLHGNNNGEVSNCIFTNCHYGMGGYGNGVLVSNCKFFDSKISNGDLSAAGKWRLNNCELNGSGAVDYLVSTHLGRVIFNGCTFKGSTTSGYMVRLTSESSAESHYRESAFQSCDFTGLSERNMNVFYISYGTYIIDNCIFNDFDKVYNCYQSNGKVRLFITGGNIRKVNKIIESGYLSLDKLVMKNIIAEKVKQIAKLNIRQHHISIENNEFYLEINTEDTSAHLGIDIPTNGGIQNFRFKDNFVVNEGTATDVTVVRAMVRSQEITTDMINISDNEFKNIAIAITVPLYPSSTKATSAIIQNNQGVNITTLIGDIAGMSTSASIIKSNIANGVILT